MRGLIQEMIYYRNNLDLDEPPDIEKVEDFEVRYRDILAVAHKEYEYEPPSKYYKDGYNLYRRLDKYMGNHLLFLHNADVPSNNNLSERLLRVYKRKQKQVMTLRSFDSFDYLCRSMSIIALLRTKSKNLYANVTKIFN